jgi:hypothetical protein
LSATLKAAVSEPTAAGLKVMAMVHVAPIATLVPQVLVSEKELALLPVMLMLVMESAAVPELVSVMFGAVNELPTGWLEKLIEFAESVTAGAVAVPVPLRATVCGEPYVLSAMLTVAVSAPVAAGLKVTVILHEAAAATLVPQVLVWVKELALVPVMLIPCPVPFRLRAALPVLVSVMV